jgi:hypothetical protein
VERRAGEPLDARDVRQRGLGQRAGSDDEDLGGEVTTVGPDVPAALRVVPGRLEQFRKWMWGRTPVSRAVRWMYAWISGCPLKLRVHSGFGAKENEYRWLGTSQAQPG